MSKLTCVFEVAILQISIIIIIISDTVLFFVFFLGPGLKYIPLKDHQAAVCSVSD